MFESRRRRHAPSADNAHASAYLQSVRPFRFTLDPVWTTAELGELITRLIKGTGRSHARHIRQEIGRDSLVPVCTQSEDAMVDALMGPGEHTTGVRSHVGTLRVEARVLRRDGESVRLLVYTEDLFDVLCIESVLPKLATDRWTPTGSDTLSNARTLRALGRIDAALLWLDRPEVHQAIDDSLLPKTTPATRSKLGEQLIKLRQEICRELREQQVDGQD